MTHIEPRTYGAPAVRTKRTADPDKLLQRIYDENPNATEWELARIVLKEATKAEREAIAFYFVHNRLIPINRYAKIPEPEEYIAQSNQRRAEKQQKENAVKVAAQVVLLDMMIDGKRLRDYTGREVAKLGGWFAKLAKLVKPNEKIGILSEARVRGAFK